MNFFINKNLLIIYFIFIVFINTGTSYAANSLFSEFHQDTPIRTMQSMIDGVRFCFRSENPLDEVPIKCSDLRNLCDQQGDGDVWDICLMEKKDEKDKKMLHDFASSIQLGAEVIDGEYAIVYFSFESDEKRIHEQMILRLIRGNWFLSSF